MPRQNGTRTGVVVKLPWYEAQQKGLVDGLGRLTYRGRVAVREAEEAAKEKVIARDKMMTLSGYLPDDEALAVAEAVTEARDNVLHKLAPGMSVDINVRAADAPSLGNIVFSIRGEVV